MSAKELIEKLQELNPDSDLILFDEDGKPFQIHSIVKDNASDGTLDHINIVHTELT